MRLPLIATRNTFFESLYEQNERRKGLRVTRRGRLEALQEELPDTEHAGASQGYMIADNDSKRNRFRCQKIDSFGTFLKFTNALSDESR